MLAGCAPKPDSSSVPESISATADPGAETADTQPAPSAVDPLTGAVRDNACTRRPYAVTFYNSPAALPQWGIGSAQVLIECLTEGNTTYQMGLFSAESGLPKVGPVGPARDTLVQFAMGGNAIPVHIGQNNYAWNLLNQYAYQDINGWYVGVSVFDMDWDRNATVSDELCWYTRQETLNNGLTSTGVAQEGTVPGMFHFAGEALTLPNTAASQSLTIQYAEGALARLDWSAEAGAYLKFNSDGSAQTDADTGAQLSFSNVLVLYASAGVKDDGYTRDYDLTQGTGLYLSGHPLDGYREQIQAIGACRIADLVGEEARRYDGKHVNIVCAVIKTKFMTTRSNTMMAFTNVEDLSGTMEIIVFPKVLADCRSALQDNAVVVINGRVSVKEEENAKLVAEKIVPIAAYTSEGTAQQPEKKARKGMYLKVPSQNSAQFAKVENLLSIFEGPLPVYIYFEDRKQLTLAPRNLWSMEHELLTCELKRILGDKNVAFK